MDPTTPTTPTTDGGLSALFDFSFKNFVTLGIVKVLYILLILAVVLGWFAVVGTAFQISFFTGVMGIIGATVLAVIEVILARVWLEVIVVLFRIERHAKALVDRGAAAV